MTEILLGFVGALVLLSLLLVGGVLGWQVHKIYARHTAPVADPPTEKELRRLKDEQKAFHTLANYSTEMAYGMTGDMLKRGDGG